MENKLNIANILRFTARYFLLVLGVLLFIFALLSGAEDMSFKAILHNSPNSLPWLVLLILIFIAWKWEMPGGILITLIGIASMYYFSFRGEISFKFMFFLSLLIIIMGSFFIISWWLRKKQKNENM